METIMMSINESWHWLGPWLVISLGTACVALIIDMYRPLGRGD